MTPALKIALSIGLAAALAAGGYAMVRGKHAGNKPAAATAPVAEFLQSDLYIVEPGSLVQGLPLTGSLVPLNEATVKAKVAGELVAVAVREGESVKQGQMLARIDLTEVQARVAAREADVQAAKAQLVWAEKNRNQQKALLDKAFISQSAFDNVQSNFDVAVARLRAADAELVLARKSQGDAVLAAPFSGVVSQRHAQPGEREFAGRIERINPAATAGSRSISVYAVIDNREGLLRGGMFAQGTLTLSQVDNALAVPASAVREEIGQTFVYAIEDGMVKKKNVRVGAPDAAGRVQVLEGLAGGDRIVRVNLGSLREGVAARLSGPEPSAAARK